jgi:hypothetical protein
MPLEQDPRAWRVSGDLPPEVIQWRRARDLQALKESHDRLVGKIRAERPQILEHHRQRNEARLREEIRLDSIARELRGLAPYDVEQEMQARVNDEVSVIVDQRSAAIRHRTIARAEGIVHRRHDIERDPAAPHQVQRLEPDANRGLR